MPRFGLILAFVLNASALAQAADLPSPAIPPAIPAQPDLLFDPTKFEVRGGFLIAPFGTEEGTSDLTGAFILPKFVSLPGWEDLLIPRIRFGGVANLVGKTGPFNWNTKHLHRGFTLLQQRASRHIDR